LARFRFLYFLLAAAMWSACKRKPESGPLSVEQTATETSGRDPTVTAVKRPPLSPAPKEIWKEFSGDKAFAEVRKQLEVGPRPAGSPELEKARLLIEESLRRAGWEVERQTFTDETPRGAVQFSNIIARYSASGVQPVPRDTQRAIVCSHYDTKRFSTISFIGANDGASSTGALLELARVLALDPALAEKTELVFFDGEEALVQFTETDGLYGSRYYSGQLVAGKRAAQFKFGILWDMIGDRDLKITLPPDSPADLARDILAAATTLQLRQHFGYFDRAIRDDHEPLNRRARIPTINLIDLDYPYWHTADDTVDRIAPESLQKIGAVTLYHLHMALGK
jgi:glutaminyl-peptide cyclotransferase